MHFKNILVTTDFSEDSKVAFDVAAYEGQMEGCKLNLIHVFEQFEPPLELRRQIWNPEALTKLKKDYIAGAEAPAVTPMRLLPRSHSGSISTARSSR